MSSFFSKHIWSLAWRETRNQRRKLFLYMSAIVLGVSALVSVQSVGTNMSAAIEGKSKSLLGADLRLRARQPLTAAIDSLFKNAIIDTSKQIQFMSMASNDLSKHTRLASINGIAENYPLHGELELMNGKFGKDFFNSQNAIIDESIAIQLSLNINDSIKVGDLKFKIYAFLKRLPGESLAAIFAPRVLLPLSKVPNTGLVQRGSIINYTRLYKLDSELDVDKVIEDNKSALRKKRIRTSTEKSQQARIQNAFDGLYKFLNLVAYISLILGGIGISSSIFVYLKGKASSIAIMRSMGAKSSETLSIYAIQACFLGIIGSMLGVSLGIGIQFLLPELLQDFLSVEFQASISFSAIITGFIIGLTTTLCFTILPILAVRSVSPLQAIRQANIALYLNKKTKLGFSLFLAAFVIALTYVQLENINLAIGFTIFIAIAFLILLLAASLIILFVKRSYKFIKHNMARHAVASLFRPNNQTRTMLISMGLGISLVGMLYFTQDSLLKNVSLGGSGDKANMVMIDVQVDQKEGVENFLKPFNLDFTTMVPIVPMKIVYLKDSPTDSINIDSVSGSVRFALTGTLRASFRSSIKSSESIVAGEFEKRTVSFEDSIFISMEDRFAKNIGLEIGDRIDFNVQGLVITTYLGSLRKVDWRRVEPNFLVLFPDGILNDAPLTYAAVLRAKSKEQSAKIQREVIADFPNISVIDLELVISTMEELVDKIALVIEFMALFSIITGFIILAGGIISSRYQRMQEHVILRTLGAVKRQLQLLLVLEYSIIGILASILGIALAFVASYLLSVYWFKIEFLINGVTAVYILLTTVVLSLIIGLLNSRGITNQSPLEILRREAN